MIHIKNFVALTIVLSIFLGFSSCTKDKEERNGFVNNEDCLTIQDETDGVQSSKAGTNFHNNAIFNSSSVSVRNKVIDSLFNLPEFSEQYCFSQGTVARVDSIFDGERVFLYTFPCVYFSECYFLNVTVTSNRLLNMHTLFMDIGNKSYQWYYDNDKPIPCCMSEAVEPYETIATYDMYPRRDYSQFTYINYNLLDNRRPRIGVQIFCGLASCYAGYVWYGAVCFFAGGPVTIGVALACAVTSSVLGTIACSDVG